MKNICFITQCSLPVPTTKGGAVETLVEYILNENEKCGRYHFTVISAFDEAAEAKSKEYKYAEFIYIKNYSRKADKIYYQIYRVLKHLGIYIPFSFEFRDVLKLLKALKTHDVYVYEAGPTTQLPALGEIIPKNKLIAHLHWNGLGEPRKDKYISKLIPVSNYIGNQWQKATGCGRDKIVPLYNCAKLERFIKECSDAEKEELRTKLCIPEENKVVVFTGRIVADKGVRELLQAYERLVTENTTLMIIGSANFGAATNTPYEQEIDSLIKKSKKSIVFTGYVHQTQLYKYYAIADIAVMPSMFQDPAPLVCIEAQATGTPLIATNVGGIPEYAGDGCAVLIDKDQNMIINLAAEMDRLLGDEALCKSMGQKGKAHVEKFSTEKYFKDFCNIIDSVK